MDVSAIRAGIQTKLQTITGMRAYANWPDQVLLPAALVRPVSMNYLEALQSATVSLVFEVVLLAAAAQNGLEAGQKLLDGYLDDSGSNSVKAAIEAGTTLGGTADYAVVTGWRDYGTMEVGDIEYVGVRFDVVVNA